MPDNKASSNSEKNKTAQSATGPTPVGVLPQQIARAVEQNVKPMVTEVQRVATESSFSGRRAVSRGTILLAMYLWLLSGAVLISFIARRTQFFPGDKTITHNLQRNRNRWFRRFMLGISEIGFAETSVPMTVGTAGIFWALRFRLESIFILLTGTSNILNMLVKRLIKRPRPTEELVTVVRVINEPSFPSGHVMYYTNFFGLLSYLLATNWHSGRLRNSLITLCTAMIAFIGPSRIYLGAHWPSDVMAGYVYGGLWFGGLMACYLRVKAWIHPPVGKTPEVMKPLQQPGDNKED